METSRAPIPVCTILFRISDAQGRWIPKATIAIVAPTAATLTTDKFGRALFTAKMGDKVHAAVDALGFRRAETELTCSRSDLIWRTSYSIAARGYMMHAV